MTRNSSNRPTGSASSSTAQQSAEIRIPARDGYSLAASLFPAQVDNRRGLVLINSATAVPRGFYRHFATTLAAAGWDALTYDYRGIGGSRPKRLRGFQARVSDWVLQDMAGILDWVTAERSPQALFLLGHSVGGQLPGLLDGSDRIDGMITCSAQSGHWRLQGPGQKLPVALHVFITLPLLARVFGYAPWSWFSRAEDLPRGVALQWSRWCRNRDYLLGDQSLPLERYSAFSAPVLAYSFADDSWGTRESVDRMMAAYPTVERRHLSPTTLDIPALGHFGCFRPTAAPLWREMIEWFQSIASQHHPAYTEDLANHGSTE